MGVTYCRWNWALFFWLVVAVFGCVPALSPAQDELTPYVSVWAQLNPEVLETASSPGSLQGEFRTAAKVRGDQAARRSWQRFVDEFDPKDGFFEDGMHARLVEWAKMELVRLQHRARGDVKAEQAQIAIMRRKAERD
ncbi:MAG: hypothetical protein QNL62_11290 [Gammaproteobacteria bacterium]|nr:hypothetical protein [Gammaproteobacteria bacterium]